jgi:SAM-dependent methyltransferase
VTDQERNQESPFPSGSFDRYDETSDTEFYAEPRFVTHIDDAAIAAVTQLYEDFLPQSGSILDVMSSWVSHLPPAPYWRVVGLGMNADELANNPQLDQWVVQDLNQDPRIPFANGEFDGACICVSIQYLTQPVKVLREIGRVVAIGGPLVVTFSNRCFPTKAVRLWQSLDDRGHQRLVEQYFREAGNWTDVQALDRSPGGGDPLYAVVARSTGAAPGESGPGAAYSLGGNMPVASGPRLARLELAVSGLPRSRAFYEESLGFMATAEPGEGQPVTLETHSGTTLVLRQSSRQPTPIGIGFALPGPEAVIDLSRHLVARSIELFGVREEAQHLGFKCLDPDGNVVEIFWAV